MVYLVTVVKPKKNSKMGHKQKFLSLSIIHRVGFFILSVIIMHWFFSSLYRTSFIPLIIWMVWLGSFILSCFTIIEWWAYKKMDETEFCIFLEKIQFYREREVSWGIINITVLYLWLKLYTKIPLSDSEAEKIPLIFLAISTVSTLLYGWWRETK